MDVKDWIRLWFSPPQQWLVPHDFWAAFCVASAWYIWKSRCVKVFQDRLLPPTLVVQQINRLLAKLFAPSSQQSDSGIPVTADTIIDCIPVTATSLHSDFSVIIDATSNEASDHIMPGPSWLPPLP
ncbi:hypothetical protein FRX31_025118, partial [Thalictrum thalictroides]